MLIFEAEALVKVQVELYNRWSLPICSFIKASAFLLRRNTCTLTTS